MMLIETHKQTRSSWRSQTPRQGSLLNVNGAKK